MASRSVFVTVVALAVVAQLVQAYEAPWDDVVSWTKTDDVKCRDPEDSPVVLPPLPMTPAESATGDEKELYRTLVAPIEEVWRDLVDTAHEAWTEGHAGKAACVLNTLQYWADADAFRCDDLAYATDEDGDDPSTNKYWRSRFTSSVATSYLKVRSAFDPATDPLDPAIQTWFKTLGDCSRNFTYSPLLLWDGDSNTENITAPQNMVWPSIQGVLSASIAINDPDLYSFAIDTYLAASDVILDDGTMESEMQRESAALFYHTTGILNFQVPFTVLARAANATFTPTNGTRALVSRVLRSLEDPSYFVTVTGVEQQDVPCYARQWPWIWYSTWGGVEDISGGVERYLAVAETEALFPRCFPETSRELMTGGVQCDWVPEYDADSPNPCDTVRLTTIVIAASTTAALLLAFVVYCCCCRPRIPKALATSKAAPRPAAAANEEAPAPPTDTPEYE